MFEKSQEYNLTKTKEKLNTILTKNSNLHAEKTKEVEKKQIERNEEQSRLQSYKTALWEKRTGGIIEDHFESIDTYLDKKINHLSYPIRKESPENRLDLQHPDVKNFYADPNSTTLSSAVASGPKPKCGFLESIFIRLFTQYEEDYEKREKQMRINIRKLLSLSLLKEGVESYKRNRTTGIDKIRSGIAFYREMLIPNEPDITVRDPFLQDIEKLNTTIKEIQTVEAPLRDAITSSKCEISILDSAIELLQESALSFAKIKNKAEKWLNVLNNKSKEVTPSNLKDIKDFLIANGEESPSLGNSTVGMFTSKPDNQQQMTMKGPSTGSSAPILHTRP